MAYSIEHIIGFALGTHITASAAWAFYQARKSLDQKLEADRWSESYHQNIKDTYRALSKQHARSALLAPIWPIYLAYYSICSVIRLVRNVSSLLWKLSRHVLHAADVLPERSILKRGRELPNEGSLSISRVDGKELSQPRCERCDRS